MSIKHISPQHACYGNSFFFFVRMSIFYIQYNDDKIFVCITAMRIWEINVLNCHENVSMMKKKKKDSKSLHFLYAKYNVLFLYFDVDF